MMKSAQIRNFIFALIIAIFAGQGAFAQSGRSIEEQLEHVESVMSQIQTLRSTIDRSQFDLDALIDSLGYEAQEIINYVTTDIAYQPYEGLLRGPKGTLYSRAGNTLDQAILLAKLLRDAGFDARIAKADFSAQMRKLLLSGAGTERLEVSPVTDPKKFTTIMNQIVSNGPGIVESGTNIESLIAPDWGVDSDTYMQAQQAASYLTSRLREQIPLGNATKAPVELEVSAYYWVQYRDLVGESWIDLHPAAGNQTIAADTLPSPDGFFAESVPNELQHRVQIELLLEVREGSELTRVPLMKPWVRPAANLLDRPITIANVPSNINEAINVLENSDEVDAKTFNSAIKAITDHPRMFAPMFNGVIPAGGQFFDLLGNVIDPMAASHPGAGLFQSLNTKTGGAVGMIGGEKGRPVTTGQVLKISLISPYGAETTYERYVFDRLEPNSRKTATIELADQDRWTSSPLVNMTLGVIVGEIPHALVLDETLEVVLQMGPMIKWLVEGGTHQESGSDLRTASSLFEQPVSELAGLDLSLLVNMMDVPSRKDFLSYRGQPNLVALTEQISAGASRVNKLFLSDVIENSRTVLRPEGAGFRLDFERAVHQGAWDTWAEHVIFGSDRDSAGDSVAENALETRISFDSTRIFTSSPKPELNLFASISEAQDAQIPDESWRGVVADLQAGYLVFAPIQPTPDDEIFTWWRVHPASGSTLGMGLDGRGVEGVGEAILKNFEVFMGRIVGQFVQGLEAYGLCVFGKAVQQYVNLETRYVEDHSALIDCGAAFLGGALVSPKNKVKWVISLFWGIIVS